MSGALSTIPLMIDVLRKERIAEGAGASNNGRPGARERPGTGASASASTPA